MRRLSVCCLDLTDDRVIRSSVVSSTRVMMLKLSDLALPSRPLLPVLVCILFPVNLLQPWWLIICSEMFHKELDRVSNSLFQVSCISHLTLVGRAG